MKKLILLLNAAAFISIPSNLVVSCNPVFSYRKLDANIANWDITADGIFNSQVTSDVSFDGTKGKSDAAKIINWPYILDETHAIQSLYSKGEEWDQVDARDFFGASFVWYENHVKDYDNGILRDVNNNQYNNPSTQILDVTNSINSLFNIFDINLYKWEFNKYQYSDETYKDEYVYVNNDQEGRAEKLLDPNNSKKAYGTYVKPNTTSSTKGTVAGQVVFGYTIGINPNVSSKFYSSSNYRISYDNTNPDSFNEYNVIQGVFIYNFDIQ